MQTIFFFFFFPCYYYIADLVSSLKSNLIRKEGYLEQQLELIYLKGLECAKFLIQRETTIAFTFFAPHHKRYP